jgi:putative endonuclease
MSASIDDYCLHGIIYNPHCPRCLERRWFVYIVECFDGTLYTGITKDVAARVEAHCLGEGAKYTRGRGPLILVYEEQVVGKSAALKREHAIKKLTRAKKKELVAGMIFE